MKTIVIILGFRRSGSTILNKAIGSHSKCFGTGEINYFFNEISNPESPCGCGKKYYSCQFWKSIIDEINIEKSTDVINTIDQFNMEIGKEITKGKNFPFFLPTLIFNRTYNYKFLKKQIEDTFYMYKKLLKHSKSDFIIDSTKSIFRALVLASFGKKHNLKFKYVFLVRDGRAVLNSTQKGYYVVNQNDGDSEFTQVETQNPGKEVKSWRFANSLYFILLKLFRKKDYIMVRHEDFCNEPKHTLQTVCSFLEIDYEPDMVQIGEHENHILGGNASRINAKEIRKSDEKWRTNLDNNILKMFKKKAGWLNSLLGYSKT